jgi:hypothetical protein
MHEPPHADGRGENQQSEDLIAAERASLLGALFAPGGLFGIWLDASFDHRCSRGPLTRSDPAYPASV